MRYKNKLIHFYKSDKDYKALEKGSYEPPVGWRAVSISAHPKAMWIELLLEQEITDE